MLVAISDHCRDKTPEIVRRAGCPFGGGVGGCYQKLCGVLSGGTLILGVLRGRVSSSESDEELRELVCESRHRFIAFAGNS